MTLMIYIYIYVCVCVYVFLVNHYLGHLCHTTTILFARLVAGLDSLSMVEFRNELLKEISSDGWPAADVETTDGFCKNIIYSRYNLK